MQLSRPPAVVAVDLDGTLVQTDTLLEMALRYVRRRPFAGPWHLLGWLLYGKVRLKSELVRRVQLDAALLPYHQNLLRYLAEQRAAGVRLVLATAAAPEVAAAVAGHVQLFADVITSAEHNLSGSRKAQALTSRFGADGFRYVGNSWRDLPVWRAAAAAVVVSGQPGLAAAVRQVTDLERHFPTRWFTWRQAAATLHSWQWVKNVLVFVPAAAAPHLFTGTGAGAAAVTFVAFCLCASGVYVLHDLFAMPAERQRVLSYRRPLAAGTVSPWVGVWLVPMAWGLAAAASILLPPTTRWLLAGYVLVGVPYSLFGQRRWLVNAAVPAVLYDLRLLAGAAAMLIPAPVWMQVVTVVLAIGLALVPRSVLDAVRDV